MSGNIKLQFMQTMCLERSKNGHCGMSSSKPKEYKVNKFKKGLAECGQFIAHYTYNI